MKQLTYQNVFLKKKLQLIIKMMQILQLKLITLLSNINLFIISVLSIDVISALVYCFHGNKLKCLHLLTVGNIAI